MKRIILTVLGCLLLLVLSLAVFFVIRFNRMRQVMLAAPAAAVDLSQLADGDYDGEFGDFLVTAKVRVKVANHRIESIKVLDQRCGPGYEALPVLDRIVAAQSPKVDVLTGATGSSRCLMAAVYRALTKS
jgi:uncharacterized protein with FMN-binding domain